MKLSIIIPIYKAERWIGRCLDSIFSQGTDESEYEVVCVIDGSPDNSANIVRKYQKSHGNIALVEQENQGVSVARNNGIMRAWGDFVAFVDADDCLHHGALPSLLNYLKINIDNLIVFRAFCKDYEWYPWVNQFHHGDAVGVKEAISKGFLHGSVWGCCYRRDFLLKNNILFPDNISNGEDTFFFLICMYFTGTIRFIDLHLYDVIEENFSLSRTYNRKRIDGIIRGLKKLDMVLCQYPIIQEKIFVLQYIRYTWLSGLISTAQQTKGIGYFYLAKSGVSRTTKFKIDNNITYMRKKMLILRKSLFLFYVLSWLKHKI